MDRYPDHATQAAYGGTIERAEPKPNSFLDDVLGRIQSLTETASDTTSRLAAVRDRAFGSQPPETLPGRSGPQAVPSAKAEEIMMALDLLASRNYAANSISAELMNRL